jgi:hypothetical protein
VGRRARAAGGVHRDPGIPARRDPHARPGARRAADADRDLLHAWHDAFLAELGSTSIRDVPAQVADRLGYGGLVLWEASGVPTNPVTNSIYQRLGYRPAEDRLVLTFT